MIEHALAAVLREVKGIAESSPMYPQRALDTIATLCRDALSAHQPSLFESVVAPPVHGTETPVRRGDPGTSHEAARRVVPKLASHRGRCLVAVLQCGPNGCTASRVEQITGLPSNSVSKRMGELAAGGYLRVLNGVTRETTRGGKGQVYVLTDMGGDWCRRNHAHAEAA